MPKPKVEIKYTKDTPKFIESLDDVLNEPVASRISYKCMYPGCENITVTTIKLLKSRDPDKRYYCNHHAKSIAKQQFLNQMENMTEEEYIKSKSEQHISSFDDLDMNDLPHYVSFNCTQCGKLSGNNTDRLLKKGNLLCSECSKKKTNFDKFGVEYNLQLDSVREARRIAETSEVQQHREETFMNTVGVKNPMRYDEYKNKCFDSNRENHNGLLWQQTDEGRETVGEFHKAHPEIVIKAKESNIRNNNGVHSLALPENREKLEVYRKEHKEEIIAKRHETNLLICGKEEQYTFGSDEFKENMTNIYGKPYPFAFGSERFVTRMVELYGEDWKSQVGFGSDRFMERMVELYGGNWKSQVGFGSNSYLISMLDKYGNEIKHPVMINGELQIVEFNDKTYVPGTKEYYSFVMNAIKRSHPELFGGAHYKYDGEIFDGSWELAYWIYCKDHNIPIEHESVILKYYDTTDEKERDYVVDFKVNGKDLVEIKGTQFFKDQNIDSEMVNVYKPELNQRYEDKHRCMIENSVEVISKGKIEQYLQYVNETYNQMYLQQFRLIAGNLCMDDFIKQKYDFTPYDIDQTKDYQTPICEGVTLFDV